jgi:hypothetical protein
MSFTPSVSREDGGAGPVGLTMAAELARYGVSVRVVDKAAARTDKSKALVIWSHTPELIDRMGCGASFVDAGWKVTAANIIAGSRQVAPVRLDLTDAGRLSSVSILRGGVLQEPDGYVALVAGPEVGPDADDYRHRVVAGANGGTA